MKEEKVEKEKVVRWMEKKGEEKGGAGGKGKGEGGRKKRTIHSLLPDSPIPARVCV
jgi:hypothetical protein